MNAAAKITDYLEALHIDWMFPDWSTLVMSVLLATAEFAIGIFLLFAIRRRLMSKTPSTPFIRATAAAR